MAFRGLLCVFWGKTCVVGLGEVVVLWHTGSGGTYTPP